MMLSASHPYPETGTHNHSSAIFNRTHALSTERTSSGSPSQHILPPPQTILSTQRPRGSTLPSYSSGSTSVVYTSISPERPAHGYEDRPQLRKERASTLGSRSLHYQHDQYIEDDHNGPGNNALPPIRVSDHEDEDPHDAHDHDERGKVQDDPFAKSSMYNLGHGGPRLPSIRTMLETRPLPTPNHMLSRGSRTPPPRSPISPRQNTRDYNSHGSAVSSSWNGRGHTVPRVGAGNGSGFHHPSPSPDDNAHGHRQLNHNGVGGMQTPMSSSSSVASSLSSQPTSLPPSSPQRDFKPRMSLATTGASILSLTAFRHKKSGATSPPLHQYEPTSRGSFEDSEYSSTARSTPRHVSEELSSSVGRGYFGAQSIPSGVKQSLASSHSNVSSSAGSFSVMSDSDGGTFSTRSRVGETAGGKKRRSRATQEQLEILNAVYQRTPFPTTGERYDLSERLGMTQRSVQIWFQNKRQGAKHSESRRREHPTPLTAISQGSPSITNLVPLTLVGSSLPINMADPHRSPSSPPPTRMNLEPARMHIPTHRSISQGSSLAPIDVDTLDGRSRRRGMSVNDLLSQDKYPHLNQSQPRNGYEARQDDEMET